MLLLLCAVLLIAWLLGWVGFHAAGGLIHVVLIVALVMLILHFVRRRSA